MARRNEDLVYFGDSQAAIKVVLRLGGRRSEDNTGHGARFRHLEKDPRSLERKNRSRRSDLLIKIKAHRGEPMNEEADTLAEVGREKEKETAKWTERTQKLIFKWTGQKNAKQRTKWRAGVRRQVRQRVEQLVLKAVREESVKR